MGLRRDLEEPEEVLWQRAADRLGVERGALTDLELLRRSLDARGRPRFIYHVEVRLAEGRALEELPSQVRRAPAPGSLAPREFGPRRRERVVIVGAGPSGLFCAHRMARAGLEPILIDRGEPVEVRGRHVSRLMHKGELRETPTSASARAGRGPGRTGSCTRGSRTSGCATSWRRSWSWGARSASSSMASRTWARIGSWRCARRFAPRSRRPAARCATGRWSSSSWIEQRPDGPRAVGVRLRGGERVEADRVILAVGHSGREMYHWLAGHGVAMERKPFAVGFRVEHPQQLINEIQYGRWAGAEGLPTADYRLTANFGEGEARRGVYSFCMCPGGQIVPSATRPGHVCINGMSHASRRGHWANSALVVTLDPSEFERWGPARGARAL